MVTVKPIARLGNAGTIDILCFQEEETAEETRQTRAWIS